MGRKTLNVSDFVIDMNRVLRESVCSAEQRQGLCAALEHVLHSTGNYRGFSYLTEDQVPFGSLPGIRAGEFGDVARFENIDHTRVKYI